MKHGNRPIISMACVTLLMVQACVTAETPTPPQGSNALGLTLNHISAMKNCSVTINIRCER